MMERSSRKVAHQIKKNYTNYTKKGDAVQFPLVKQDRGKVDSGNLTGVIVNINKKFGMCQVTVKTGVLQPWCVYHKLTVVPKLSNNHVLNGLEEAFKNYRHMDVIVSQTVAINESLVGGQSIFQCKCKGKCTNDHCKCYKHGQTCTSACHCNSRCCENHDENKARANAKDMTKNTMHNKTTADLDKSRAGSTGKGKNY